MENQIFIEKNNNSWKSNGIQNQNEENKKFVTKTLLMPRKSKMKETQVKFITKKSFNERKECQKKSTDNFIFNEGRWTEEEHEKFLEGIVLYNINWKKVKTLIETRTPMQVRSHAQKFFNKMKVCKDENLGIDFTLNTVRNFTDMINQIKNNNSNYNIINVFKYLTDKCNNHEKTGKKIVERNYNNITFQRSELNNQPYIINLKEVNSNINDKNFFFNQINNINKPIRMEETQNINDYGTNDMSKKINQINIFNIFQNLLTMNYDSNVFNFILLNNLYSSIYNNTNNINNLLINYLISNYALNNSNIINGNALLSLVLQNKFLNSINNINYNINNNINLKDINFCTNNNNYNSIINISNGNNIDKVKENDINNLFINSDKKDNINLRDNNNDYSNNIDNKNNYKINKNNFIFCSDKQLNKINDKKKNNNDENSNNYNIFN
jgi:SHAQKYF class myb-like DNA-binding protein